MSAPAKKVRKSQNDSLDQQSPKDVPGGQQEQGHGVVLLLTASLVDFIFGLMEKDRHYKCNTKWEISFESLKHFRNSKAASLQLKPKAQFQVLKLKFRS